jgi:acid-sensing ion channel, other
VNCFSFNMATVAALVCSSGTFDDIDPDNKTDCEQCAKNLKLLMGNVNRNFFYCNHIYIQNDCPGMYKPVVSEDGVCFVYNDLQVLRNFDEPNEDFSEEWTLEGGYRNNSDHVDIYPRAGSKRGLQTLFNVDLRLIDALCKDSVQSFKVYLHLPNEVPQPANNFLMMPYQYDTVVAISPKVTVTEPELRDFPVAKRQCYFSDERYLRFFRHYTQNNCEIECLVNLTLKRCGCLKFYMPSKC